MAEIAVLLVLEIRFPASSRISMRNQFVYDGWIRFYQYSADVFYLSVTIEDISVTLKPLMGDKGSKICPMVISN